MALSFMPDAQGTSQGGNPAADAVQQLLASLDTAPHPQPLQFKRWQTILGPLGDAIQSMASVRAGGAPAPVGPFAANVAAREAEYRKDLQSSEDVNRELRNRIRIGAFEENQRRQRETQVAGIRAGKPVKAEFVRDVGGTAHRIRQWLDPQTRETLAEDDLGPAGYAPTILGGVATGENGQPEAGFFRINKGGGGAVRVPGPGGSRLEPQIPAGLAQNLGGEEGTLAGIPGLKKVFSDAEQAVGGSDGTLRQMKNWALSKAAGTSVGPIVAPPELVNYYSSARSVLFPYVRSLSGATFPEAELQRYESQFPIPGVDPPEVADHKWQTLIDQMVRDISAKYKTMGRKPPGALAPAVAPADDIQKLIDAEKAKRNGRRR